MPSDFGQAGVALTHTVDEWATKLGLYATQFHSRQGYSGVIKSQRAGAAPPFIPGDPDGLNPTYITQFPERIRMFGLSFETKVQRTTVFGELTYRPNQPLQFNAADLLGAVLSTRRAHDCCAPRNKRCHRAAHSLASSGTRTCNCNWAASGRFPVCLAQWA